MNQKSSAGNSKRSLKASKAFGAASSYDSFFFLFYCSTAMDGNFLRLLPFRSFIPSRFNQLFPVPFIFPSRLGRPLPVPFIFLSGLRRPVPVPFIFLFREQTAGNNYQLRNLSFFTFNLLRPGLTYELIILINNISHN